MYNPVHGKKFQVCQWTGEAISEENRFRIPMLGAGNEWTGCYGSPSAAIAALVDKVTHIHAAMGAEANKDILNELFEEFEASIRRKPGKEDVKFTIVAAPSYTELATFGGKTSLADYHAKYDHDLQQEIYTQVLPARSEVFDEVTSDKGETGDVAIKKEKASPVLVPSNAPKKWRLSKVFPGAKDEAVRVQMPRGIAGVIEWFKKIAKNSDCTDAATIYFHPLSDTLFAVGNPKDWQGTGNKIASDILGKSTVFGHVELYHKNGLRDRKKEKKDKKKEACDAGPLPLEKK